MRASATLRNAARTPLIRFVGRRSVPQSVDHTPRPHPASPTGALPNSFAAYRVKAQQHGPLGSASFTQGAIGRNSGSAFGPVAPKQGEFFDRSDLPARFHRVPYSQAEIEAIETGGATSTPSGNPSGQEPKLGKNTNNSGPFKARLRNGSQGWRKEYTITEVDKANHRVVTIYSKPPTKPIDAGLEKEQGLGRRTNIAHRTFNTTL